MLTKGGTFQTTYDAERSWQISAGYMQCHALEQKQKGAFTFIKPCIVGSLPAMRFELAFFQRLVTTGFHSFQVMLSPLERLLHRKK
jgi:hypothetical protein